MSGIGNNASVYVVNARQVVTDLYYFSDDVVARLKVLMLGIANRIAVRARTSITGHSKSNKLASSVRTSVKEYGDKRQGPFRWRTVSASVIAGGTRAVRYAHAFERGFADQVHVPSHTRGSALMPRTYVGRTYGPKGGGGVRTFKGGFNVNDYWRRHVVKAHLYMDAALSAEAPAGLAAVESAVGSAARAKGF